MTRARELAAPAALAILAAIGLYGAYSGLRFGLGEATEPGPGLMPAFAGGALVLFAIVVALTEGVPAAGPGDPPAAADATRRVFGYAAGIVAFALLMKPLGTLPTIVLFFVWIMRGVERQSWRLTLALTAGAALGAWLLFVKALKVSLPMVPS